MRVRVDGFLTVALLSCLISCTPGVALAQTTMDTSSDPWDVVRSTPSGTELEIQLDDGTHLKGRLLTATARMLRLSRTHEITELQRECVLKVYQLSPKPEELRRMLRNVGTIIGVAAGLEISKNKPTGFFLMPALGGTAGAVGGYAFGNRMRTRLLIYDAKPRRVTERPVSGTDNPQALTRPRIISQSFQHIGGH